MAGINKVILVGNLGSDPEMRSTNSGTEVCNFTLATNASWKDKDGKVQDATEWHTIVVWGKLAELCAKFLSKGRQVYLEGKIQTRGWEDKEGNKRKTTEIVAREVQFLGSKDNKSSGGYDAPPVSNDSAHDESIPF